MRQCYLPYFAAATVCLNLGCLNLLIDGKKEDSLIITLLSFNFIVIGLNEWIEELRTERNSELRWLSLWAENIPNLSIDIEADMEADLEAGQLARPAV